MQNIKTVTYAALRDHVFAFCTSSSKRLSGMHLDALQNNDDDEDLDALRKGTAKGGTGIYGGKTPGRVQLLE